MKLKDKLTLGLAGAAALTAGSLIIGEAVKLFRKRQKKDEDPIEKGEIAAEEAAEVAALGYRATPENERLLFNVLVGFILGGSMARLIAVGIRDGWWPVKNVYLSDYHIHHFIPGILIANGAALLSFLSEKQGLASFIFGAGVGMTVDEAALLLDLRDVYWTEEGILSVQLSLGVAALLAGTVISMRMLNRGEEIVQLDDKLV